MRVHAALLTATIVVPLASCTPQGDPGLGRGFRDTFERSDLGTDYHATSPAYRIVSGGLRVQGARNHPLWLKRRLPDDVRVEFDVRSESPDGDIKAEIFGDGASFAQSASYTSTGYVIIFGGWRNSLDVVARMDEHGEDRVERPSRRVEVGRTYHLVIERRGGHLKATVDGQLLGELRDPDPLRGRGHDHFAFNNWDVPLVFDNLVVTPL